MGRRWVGKRDEKKEGGAERWEEGGRGSSFVLVGFVMAKCYFSLE